MCNPDWNNIHVVANSNDLKQNDKAWLQVLEEGAKKGCLFIYLYRYNRHDIITLVLARVMSEKDAPTAQSEVVECTHSVKGHSVSNNCLNCVTLDNVGVGGSCQGHARHGCIRLMFCSATG